MLNPALEFCMSACVTEMRGDYNFEKRCNPGPSSGRFSELCTQSARPLQQGNDPTLEPDLPTTSALF